MEYFSELTNNTYAVDQCAKTFNEAEAWCAGNFGGHLVSYYSLQEQLEVGWHSVQRSFCVNSGAHVCRCKCAARLCWSVLRAERPRH